MIITKKPNGSNLDLVLEGRLDTNTAPQLEKEIAEVPEEVTELTVDMEKIDYLSSAGLRVLLVAHKKMAAKDARFVLQNVQPGVKEVLDMTGFSKIITLK